MTNEELYLKAHDGDSNALETLCRDYKPLFLSEAKPYIGKMETYSKEDFLQEGWICTWKVCAAGNYSQEGGAFGAYLKKAYKQHLMNLWRDYTRKNMVLALEATHEQGDGFSMSFSGCTDRYYVVSEQAEAYRAKHREECRRSYQKKAAAIDAERAAQGLPKVYRRSMATADEKAAHDEEMRQRRNSNARAYQREHKAEIKTKKAAYFQENKERYRLNTAVRRTRQSVAKFEAEGNEKRAAKARERLAKYEAELAALKAG